MKKFSENDADFGTTGKEHIIETICSKTGLPKESIKKIYESMKIDNLSDAAIVEHFDRATTPKNAITCSAFFGSLVAGISGVEGKLTDIQKTGVTKGILQALSDFSDGVDGNTMEPTELLATVKGLIEIKNPKAKGLLSTGEGMLVLEPVEHDFSKLNEALETGNEDTVQLYEGLRRILGKNTRRWGNAYRIENSYQEIMKFIDKEAERIQLESSIVSIDDSFHIDLLNDLLSGSVNPMYKHINGVRQFVPDMQSLLFDMVVLVNCYMRDSEYAMNYLSRTNVQEYQTCARNLLASIASSRKTSRILIDGLKKSDISKPSQDAQNPYPSSGGEGYYDNFLQDCTNGINGQVLKYNTWNLPLKAVVDMLNLCKSMSSDFNMKIRPLIRDYTTKAYGITGRIERAKREMAMFKINS